MKRIARQTLACLVIASMFNAAHAVSPPSSSWEVSGEFNYLSNQVNNGLVWLYGWKPMGSPNPASFTLLSGSIGPLPYPQYRGWQKTPGTALPQVGQGILMAPWSVPASYPYPITLPARGISLHPGYQCELAVVRFKAPTAGQYRVSGQFHGLDANPFGQQTGTLTTNRIVADSLSTSVLHSGNVSVPNQVQSSFTSKLVMLKAGGTLDFEVGCGANNTYAFGSTGLHAVIERTPVEYCEHVPPNPTVPGTGPTIPC